MLGRMVVRGGLALLLLGALSAAPAEQPQTHPDSEATIRSLESQLATERAHNQELTDRVIKMSREMADLRKQLEAARAAATLRVPVQPGRQVPEGWTLRQFNGMTYYLVPLDAHGEHVTPAAH
jgi:hypothetical protein